MQVHQLSSNRISFKSHVVKNDVYNDAIKQTKTDFSYVGNLNRALLTLKSLYGISDNKQHDFVEFIREEDKFLTKVNGKIDPKYTIRVKDGTGPCLAIINYAMKNSCCPQKPLTRSEEVVCDLKLKLEMAESAMRKEMLKRLELFV